MSHLTSIAPVLLFVVNNETCESFFSETHHQTLQVSVAIFHGICMIVFAYEYDEVYRANFFSNTNLFGIRDIKSCGATRGRGCRSWPQNATISFPKTSVLKFSGGGCPRSPAGNRTWWYLESPSLKTSIFTPELERFMFNCYFLIHFPVGSFIHPTIKK